MKLVSISQSSKPDKKLVAKFILENGKTKTTHFGARHMDDYTLKGDKEQRDRYRARHQKDLLTKDPSKAGYLSYYILWGNSTSKQANIQAFKKKFNV
jgi:hypothetical protein